MYASPILLYETTDPPSTLQSLRNRDLKFECYYDCCRFIVLLSLFKTKTCQQRLVSYDEWDIKFHKCNKTNGNIKK